MKHTFNMKHTFKRIPFLAFCFAFTLLSCAKKEKIAETAPVDTVKTVREVWTKEQANAWYTHWGWLRGSDFIPSTAINQLEMWQAESFDTATINRELGWAESIGMNSMRVYLHHLAWQVDPTGFKDRVNTYLTIADKHHVSTLFVFMDDCWNPEYEAGKQPEPKPGIHNSGWVRDPGPRIFADTAHTKLDSTQLATLEQYTKDVLTRFKDDKRIVLWDLYNEPGNSNNKNKSLPLLQKMFQWGREVNPSQPLSSGIWAADLVDLNKYQLANSDVITYHNYDVPAEHKKMIDTLRAYGRPLICTEYMARTRGSLFSTVMPMLKAENIGAYNWGFVAGKSNTIYAWNNPMPKGGEPKLWFHDIFRKDGTPYKKEEVEVIKSLTGKK
jgi:hypothetical protein